MAIPTVYRSTDAGAPTIIRTVAGSFLTALDAILVNGYGSKSPAGWSIKFSGTNVRAYENARGRCYRFADTGVNSVSPIYGRGFYDMTDIDTGSYDTGLVYGFRAPANTNTAATWIALATENTFYIGFYDNPSNDSRTLFGAGVGISNSVGDEFFHFVLGQNQEAWVRPPPCFGLATSGNQSPCGGWGSALSGSTGLKLGGDHTGLVTGVGAGLMKPDIPGSRTLGFVGQDSNLPALPSANSADAAAMRAYVVHGLSGSSVVRGRLPGLYLPLFHTGNADNGDIDVGGKVIDPSSETLLLRAGNTTHGARASVLIETALDWGD